MRFQGNRVGVTFPSDASEGTEIRVSAFIRGPHGERELWLLLLLWGRLLCSEKWR